VQRHRRNALDKLQLEPGQESILLDLLKNES
jgi:hypothetical protein